MIVTATGFRISFPGRQALQRAAHDQVASKGQALMQREVDVVGDLQDALLDRDA